MYEDEQNYFKEPEFLEILEKYESSLRNGIPIYMDADELTDIAEYYMLRHKEKQANEAITLAVQLHPTSVDPQIFLARQEMFHDHLEKAHRICDAIADQNDREVIFLNAELLIREQQVAKACQLLENISEKLEEGKTMFIYDCAGIFMDYALWDKALEWTERILAQNAKHLDALLIKSEAMLMKGEYKEVIEQLNHLLDQDPYLTIAWNLLAEAQGATGLYQEAIESVEYVLAIDEHNRRALLTKANCLFHLNHLEEAHTLYQAFMKANEEDDTICYLDAVCLAQLERYGEAADLLERANEIGDCMSREQFNIYMQQMHVESHLHHLEKAITALQNAMELAPEGFTPDYELLLGHIYLENGYYAEAEQCFEWALDKSKDKRATMLMIGVAFAESQHYSEALKVLNAMVQMFGDEKGYSAKPYLAYCYYQTGDNQKFLQNLKEAVSNSRETTELLFSTIFPDILPDEYYLYAFKATYGRFPEVNE